MVFRALKWLLIENLILKAHLFVDFVDLEFQAISHRNEQRLTQAQGRTERPERKRAAFIDQQHAVGPFGQGRQVAVGDDQGFGLMQLGNTQAMLGLLAISILILHPYV